SPALAAVLLKPHGAKPDLLMRGMNRLLGRFFNRFNAGFARAGDGYSTAAAITMRHGGIALAIYGGLIVLTWLGFNSVPGGFIPAMDKKYLVPVGPPPPPPFARRTEGA